MGTYTSLSLPTHACDCTNVLELQPVHADQDGTVMLPGLLRTCRPLTGNKSVVQNSQKIVQICCVEHAAQQFCMEQCVSRHLAVSACMSPLLQKTLAKRCWDGFLAGNDIAQMIEDCWSEDAAKHHGLPRPKHWQFVLVMLFLQCARMPAS